MMMSRCATDEAERREFFEAFRASGVTAIFENAGEEGNDPLRLLGHLAHFTYTTDLLRDTLFKAVKPSDVPRAKEAGKFCLAFTTNGVPLSQRWAKRDEFRELGLFHQLGVRMMHLTYNRRNPLGDGAGEPNDGGLSDFGRQAIAEMNRLGVIVDVATPAAPQPGGRKALRGRWPRATRPAGACTDTSGASPTRSSARSAIRGRSGPVHPRFLGGSGDIAAFLDHIDYAIKTFGADHAAVGTDVAYVSRNDKAEARRSAMAPTPLAPRSPAPAGSTSGPRTITSKPPGASRTSHGPTGPCSQSAWSSGATPTRSSARSSAGTCSGLEGQPAGGPKWRYACCGVGVPRRLGGFGFGHFPPGWGRAGSMRCGGRLLAGGRSHPLVSMADPLHRRSAALIGRRRGASSPGPACGRRRN